MSPSSLSSVASLPQCYTIRAGKPSDAEAALKLFKTVRAESPFLLLGPDEGINDVVAQERQLALMQKEKKQMIFLAFCMLEPVGFIGVSRGSFAKNRHTASLAAAVLKPHQKKGLGSHLIQTAFDWARQEKISRLELSVVTDNTPAVSLYKKNSFSIEGTKRNSFRIGGKLVDEYMMARMLESSDL